MIFKDLKRVLVTGPHRAGTTIATEMIAEELNLRPVRESELAHPRFEGDTEPELSEEDIRGFEEGVLQGATTFKWLPEIADHFDAIVVVKRNTDDIIKSQLKYRGRQLDNPKAKYDLILHLVSNGFLPYVIWVSYENLLSKHPRFCTERGEWAPRQTCPC